MEPADHLIPSTMAFILRIWQGYWRYGNLLQSRWVGSLSKPRLNWMGLQKHCLQASNWNWT